MALSWPSHASAFMPRWEALHSLIFSARFIGLFHRGFSRRPSTAEGWSRAGKPRERAWRRNLLPFLARHQRRAYEMPEREKGP
jgi:hypothetical protein